MPPSKSKLDISEVVNSLLGAPVIEDPKKELRPVSFGSTAPLSSGSPTKPPNSSEKQPLDASTVRNGLLAAYDKLNSSIREAEKQLFDLHTPVECHAVYCRELFENGDETHYAIGWQKVGTEWRLCHGAFDARHPVDCEWRPLIECPVDIRVDAVGGYGKLRSELIEAAQEYINKVRKADEALSTLLGKKV